MFLGRYCETSIDVGSALTANTLRNNWQQVHSSTYRALTPDELVNPDEIKARDEFDTDTKEKLGPLSYRSRVGVTISGSLSKSLADAAGSNFSLMDVPNSSQALISSGFVY